MFFGTNGFSKSLNLRGGLKLTPLSDGHVVSLSALITARSNRISARRSALRPPCFHCDLRLRSPPSVVFGPVDFPPWIRQRPFFIAGDLQGAPARVFAPHRGAVFGAPGGFPFFRPPRGNG